MSTLHRAGWLGICALVLVALPLQVANSGLTAAEWWGQVVCAAGFGLLNTFLVFDTVKVIALFVTGPYVILRLPEGPLRAIVREGLRPIHKPLAAFL